MLNSRFSQRGIVVTIPTPYKYLHHTPFFMNQYATIIGVLMYNAHRIVYMFEIQAGSAQVWIID